MDSLWIYTVGITLMFLHLVTNRASNEKLCFFMEFPEYNKQGDSILALSVLHCVFIVVSDPVDWLHCSVDSGAG